MKLPGPACRIDSGRAGSGSSEGSKAVSADMECPICGEDIPLNSRVCGNCGNEVDQFFLTEESKASRLSKRITDEAARQRYRVPRGQKPRVGFFEGLRIGTWKRYALIALAVAIVVGVGLGAYLMLASGGSKVENSPTGVIEAYYEALSNNDVGGMLSLVTSGFQPTADQRIGISSAVENSTYEISGPVLQVQDENPTAAVVEIQDLNVQIKNAGGDTIQRSLAEYMRPLLEKEPGSIMVVKTSRVGGKWMIADTPVGGWEAGSEWLLGEPVSR